MKKVVLSLAVLFSMAMVSCGGNKAAEADSAAADSVEVTEVAVEEVTVDSAAPAADSAAAPAADSAAAAQ
ncbi:MAG: hypothetical protein K2G69_04205 [Muribaculaceae bacterium]|nr:hypothetical protein [Muribaculaceae bacterium]